MRRPLSRGERRGFFTVFTLIALVFTLGTTWSAFTFVTALTTAGRIVDEHHDKRRRLIYLVEFTTKDGELCQYDVRADTVPQRLSPGDEIKVRYPQYGQRCLNVTGERDSGPTFVPLMGLTLLAVGVVGLYTARKERNPSP